jgi:hypothetical protein
VKQPAYLGPGHPLVLGSPARLSGGGISFVTRGHGTDSQEPTDLERPRLTTQSWTLDRQGVIYRTEAGAGKEPSTDSNGRNDS